MANLYITELTKSKLDVLVDAEKRTNSTEIDFLCDRRLKELGLPDVITPSVSGENIGDGQSSQEKNPATPQNSTEAALGGSGEAGDKPGQGKHRANGLAAKQGRKMIKFIKTYIVLSKINNDQVLELEW